MLTVHVGAVNMNDTGDVYRVEFMQGFGVDRVPMFSILGLTNDIIFNKNVNVTRLVANTAKIGDTVIFAGWGEFNVWYNIISFILSFYICN